MNSPPDSREEANRIARLARDEPARLGLSVSCEPGVRLLGQGESYAVWLLEFAGTEPLVVRVLRRPPADLPQPMSEEFAALALLPDDIGPSPVLMELTGDNPMAAPYIVCGYVPGRVASPQEWNAELLAAHAQQLARLHTQAFDRWGGISAPTETRSRRLSLTEKFAAGLEYWTQTAPEVFGDPTVARLLPRVETFLAAAEPAFERLCRFAVVHGDLVVCNIVIDAERKPRYVDWEWAEIGDPAQDLAAIGGYIATQPWYLPLDRSQIRRLLGCYLSHLPDTQDEKALGDLEIRRDAWEVYERFLSSLHFRTRQHTPEDIRTCRYTNAVARLTSGLERRLG